MSMSDERIATLIRNYTDAAGRDFKNVVDLVHAVIDEVAPTAPAAPTGPEQISPANPVECTTCGAICIGVAPTGQGEARTGEYWARELNLKRLSDKDRGAEQGFEYYCGDAVNRALASMQAEAPAVKESDAMAMEMKERAK